MSRTTSESKKAASGFAGRVWQLAFAAWILLVNFLYYLQFRDLFLARFGAWIRRWH
jgi:hypothetical protein